MEKHFFPSLVNKLLQKIPSLVAVNTEIMT